MIDPTSDIGETTVETAPTCAACGEPIVDEPDHRVVTRIEESEVRTDHFCDETCLAPDDRVRCRSPRGVSRKAAARSGRAKN